LLEHPKMVLGFRRRNKKKPGNRLHPFNPFGSFLIRASHKAVSSRVEKAEDEDLKLHLKAIEADGRWHPTGRKWWTPLLIILGFFHPAYRNTHKYLLPENQEDIVDMTESYFAMLTLFYSLVGVMAVEMSLSESPVELETESGARLVLISLSRLGWFALGPLCLTCVAGCIHVVWSLQAISPHVRRRFVLDHQLFFSMPYSLAPICFVLLHISIISGSVASALRAQADWLRLSEITGLVLGTVPAVALVYASGHIMEDAFRPWWLADKRKSMADKYRSESQKGTAVAESTNKMSSIEDEETKSNLVALGLPFVEELLALDGLTWKTLMSLLKETGSHALLDSMLFGVGVEKAGHRAAIILRLQRSVTNEKADVVQAWKT